MKEETRQRLSELIVEELAEKIRGDQSLKRKLEVFTDLPVEKVADAIIKQFDYLLSSDLRELILHLIEQEVAQEKSNLALVTEPLPSTPEPIATEEPSSVEAEPVEQEEQPPTMEVTQPIVEPTLSERLVTTSIMEHFGSKELFPTEPMDIDVLSIDWLYVYGFSYAPDSSGKGIPTKKLVMKGIDQLNNIFLMDYGDIRFFVSKLKSDDHPRDKTGKPALASQKTSQYKFEHEHIINILRSEDVLVPLSCWSIIKGLDELLKAIEKNYVDALRALIDMHDATDWNVDVMAFDEHLLQLPFITEVSKERTTSRTSRHARSTGTDVRKMERLIFREKTLAQEIHNALLIHAQKNKVDYMVRLDSAIMGDWKSMLSARYTVGKEKRRVFFQDIAQLQRKYEEFQLLFSVTSPSKTFALAS
ncbi:MAG: GvpL/GvpF family gas vesicle protein [Ignavibacteriae bacterium]|nr:GvpL/GvpF family gas vesicle protein [Ignavibacteria bacterium]MBI3364665.1 GvpL/GvpF family gas vesicle protein [Ignavibacteriota bacterium]